MSEGTVRIEEGRDVLEIPHPVAAFGSKHVLLNGTPIPSGGIWNAVKDFFINNKSLSKKALMAEAKRASIYLQAASNMLVYTNTPPVGSQQIAEHIYLISERQRLRPLLEEYKALITRFDIPMTPDNVDTMHKVCAALGYEPFAMGDKRIMYSKDRERIYEAFGSKDWVRLYVYFKRPGSSVYNVDIEAIAQA